MTPKKRNEDSSIAVIKNDIEYIKRDINDIKEVLREGYATKDELKQTAEQTERRLMSLEKSSNLWRWLSPTLAAVAGSVMTFLIINYITSFAG